MIAAILIVCYTLLVILWQDDIPKNSQVSQWSLAKDGGDTSVDASKTREGFQERAPRSIQDLESENQNDILRIISHANIPAKDIVTRNNNNTPLTSLDDLFISVKTTKSFHQSRLNVILKTWFVLARDQVSFVAIIFCLFDFVVYLYLATVNEKSFGGMATPPTLLKNVGFWS